MINVGTQSDTSRKAVEVANQYEQGVYAIIGLHPIHTSKSYHDTKELGDGGKEFTSRGEAFDTAYYRELGKARKVIAIGECGLDYYRLDGDTKALQHRTFSEQIALANELGKPLMLHIRDAYDDALAILQAEAKVKGDVHFFAGDWNIAKKFLDLGLTLSFTGVVTFTHDYDEVIQNTPLNMILSETDAPYVTPVPHRGKRNESMHIPLVVGRIAEIRGEDPEKVREQLFANACRMFSIDK